ncbi:MAG: dienelactone hydrolase family protein [Aquamicrobium sp.]|uniref:alpha/beta hydrolase family protein n=1 Tax=Mesorhizobium sp. Pch-S TaxID=2082387 RepID=UPI001A91C79F|nr:dienelactone hydrolase family protein [Mesorhizobium sp. Pch-S]MBR2688913.1 dienelactone hydrolase family protein [Aquamicrobium sp.]
MKTRTAGRSALRFLALMLITMIAPIANAAATERQAGILRLQVPDADGPFDVMVWYPTDAPQTPWQAGPFTIDASRDAPIAAQGRFPVVLFSHGSGGTPLGHRQLAGSLARRGFVVVAPAHLGDTATRPRFEKQAQIFAARPRQAMEALQAALQDERLAAHVDAARIGMIGYSAGGYTALALAGARLDASAASTYCSGTGRDDIGSCGPAKDSVVDAIRQLGKTELPEEPRLKALVLMDPLSIVFDRVSLKEISLPIFLLRPQDDAYMNASHNALALAKGLSFPPQESVVPGRHFVFIDPCPSELAAEAPLICSDEPQVDRAAVHEKFEGEIAAFLEKKL